MKEQIKKTRENLYKAFFDQNFHLSLIDFLNANSADEIMTVNLRTNTTEYNYFIDGKYNVPERESLLFSEIHEFVRNYIIHPEDKERYSKFLNPKTILNDLKNSPFRHFVFDEFRIKLKDGNYRWVEYCVVSGVENDVKDGCYKLYIFDIENLKALQQGNTVLRSDKQDRVDALTGLYKYQPFFEEATNNVKARKDKKWCILAIDIEHFKLFNDWYGRETGDFLLGRIAALIRKIATRDGGTAGYLGKDHFALVMENDEDKISSLYEDIKSAIDSFGQSIGFLPSFGIAPIKEDSNLEDDFDHATIASNKAKLDTRRHISYYDERMHLTEGYEYRIISNFMKALKNNEITFYLQPQCRISTGKIVGAEVLARWIKPDGTIIMPNDYIPILEKYGFIIDLDIYLWERACMAIRNWIDLGHKVVPISLNVSRSDIMAIDIHEHFSQLVKKYDLDKKLIKLEITESAYTETTTVITDLVNKLRNDGFMVLMDDFGSGYSSLNMLSALQVDAIKLDAMFLNFKEADQEKGIHILESVVNMAKQIALPIIVEGVETKEQSDFLEDLGCRYVQGYYFYKPMSREAFEDIVRDETQIDDRGFVAKTNLQFRMREFLDQNIYSDSMLNSIIGACAIYTWHGDDVDIIRFNEQFYKSVDDTDFHGRLLSIQRWLPEGDVPKIYQLLEQAKKDRLNGSTGLLHFRKTDNTLTTYNIHFFYIGNREGRDTFYGSANNVTSLGDLKDYLDLISKYTNETYFFLHYVNNKWTYRIGTYGYQTDFGYTLEELNELFITKNIMNNFVNKLELKKIVEQMEKREDFTESVEILNKTGEHQHYQLRFISTFREANNVSYFLIINKI